MNFNTRTYYVANNVTTLAQIREGAPSHPAFDESSKEKVQELWDSGVNMRCLSGNRPFLNKDSVGGARICFVCKDFYHFLANGNNSNTGLPL